MMVSNWCFKYRFGSRRHDFVASFPSVLRNRFWRQLRTSCALRQGSLKMSCEVQSTSRPRLFTQTAACSSQTTSGLCDVVQNLLGNRELKKSQFIRRSELLDALDNLQKHDVIGYEKGLKLLQFCGSHMPFESAEVKATIAEQILCAIESQGLYALDIYHYNAVLQIYSENNYQFSIVGFLQLLLSKGIKPDIVTFERLIASCCRSGDHDAATQLIAQMKLMGLQPTSNVMNSLVEFYAKTGDTMKLEVVLGMLRNDLSATQSMKGQLHYMSYIALAKGFAACGNLTLLEKALTDIQTVLIRRISNDNCLELVKILASCGFCNYVPQVLCHLDCSTGSYRYDVLRVALELIQLVQFDAVAHILHSESMKGFTNLLFLCKSLLKFKVCVAKLKQLCNASAKLQHETLKNFTRLFSKVAASEGMFDVSEEMLGHAQSQGCTLNAEDFGPLLLHYCRQRNDINKVQFLLNWMHTLNVPVYRDSVEDWLPAKFKNVLGDLLQPSPALSCAIVCGSVTSWTSDEKLIDSSLSSVTQEKPVWANDSGAVAVLKSLLRDSRKEGLSIDLLYRYLLSACKRCYDYETALQTWTTIKEDNHCLSPQTQELLNELMGSTSTQHGVHLMGSSQNNTVPLMQSATPETQPSREHITAVSGPISIMAIELSIIAALKSILVVSREEGLSTDIVYRHILLACKRGGHVDTVLQTWEQMQEENLCPSAKTQELLNELIGSLSNSHDAAASNTKSNSAVQSGTIAALQSILVASKKEGLSTDLLYRHLLLSGKRCADYETVSQTWERMQEEKHCPSTKTQELLAELLELALTAGVNLDSNKTRGTNTATVLSKVEDSCGQHSLLSMPCSIHAKENGNVNHLRAEKENKGGVLNERLVESSKDTIEVEPLDLFSVLHEETSTIVKPLHTVEAFS